MGLQSLPKTFIEKSMIEFGMGSKEKADQYLDEFINNYRNEGWPNIAYIYAYRGNKDKAFEWLNLAIENQDASLFENLNYPEFKVLKDDPRWNTFIDRLNMPDHQGISY